MLPCKESPCLQQEEPKNPSCVARQVLRMGFSGTWVHLTTSWHAALCRHSSWHFLDNHVFTSWRRWMGEASDSEIQSAGLKAIKMPSGWALTSAQKIKTSGLSNCHGRAELIPHPLLCCTPSFALHRCSFPIVHHL